MSVSIYSNPSFSDSPYGLKLQQTITSSGSVTIPTGIRRVYAVCIGGGGGGGTSFVPNIRNITAISGNGTTVTYTCENNFVAGMRVTTVGSSIAGYNVTFAAIATASSTQFTVTNATTGTPTLTNATASAEVTTISGLAGIQITSVSPSTPVVGQVTYSVSSAYEFPIGVPVTISGATPAGYNGTFVIVASTTTSFTVNNGTTGAASGTINMTGIVRYTTNGNNFNVGAIVSMSAHSPASFNLSNQVVIAASSSTFYVANGLARATSTGGNANLSPTDRAGAGGGGAGGFSAGWTYATTTCTVGAGGAGGQMAQAFTADSTTFNVNNPNGRGKNGGATVYGMVVAGGGVGGSGTSLTAFTATIAGGAGGGNSPNTAGSASAISYTGAPLAAVNGIGYGGGGGSDSAGGAGVSGGGGGRVNSAVTTASLTGNAGGQGLIGGGAGSVFGLNTVTGASGGAGDKFVGGAGSSGTGYGVGAGGGGGGYIAAGSAASGNNGGNGGNGGGGGGAANNNGTGGNGGNGVIYLYY